MDQELIRYRNGAVAFLIVLILGTLGVFAVVETDEAARTDQDSERRTCQMSAVVQGASLDRAQLMCRGY